MLAAFASLVWTLEGGTAEQCTRLAMAALADGRLFADSNAVMVPAAITALVYADAEKATEHLERCLVMAREHGSPREVAVARTWRGMAMLSRGELSEAGAELEGAREALVPLRVHAGTWTQLEAQTVALHTARGDLPAARAVLDAAHLIDEGTDAMRTLRAAELELLIAEGDAERALSAASAYGAVHARNTNPVGGRWRSVQARALARLGRREEALARAQEELVLARAYGAPGAVAYSVRELGLLVGGEAGIEGLEEAVATAEGTPARLEHVRSLLALGKALRLARRPTEARSPLLRALEFAAAHGIDGVAADARTELAAAGVRPRREVFSGVDSLTPSERRVADLAAAGASNRDIAQALYVTPKTVEVHLTSAYRKLGLRSRRELPGALVG
jgi:DNA-binding CsgD family transcriptional regulator